MCVLMMKLLLLEADCCCFCCCFCAGGVTGGLSQLMASRRAARPPVNQDSHINEFMLCCFIPSISQTEHVHILMTLTFAF